MQSPRIIVSLTTWSARIKTVDIVIKKMKQQTICPDKIVLYLASSEFHKNEIPKKLVSLCDDLFEIRWCKDLKSYKKLIPALEDFPEDIIITVDDDIDYDERLIELLINGYKKYPKCIQAHRVTTIRYLGINNIKTTLDSKDKIGEKSILYKFTGVGGVLYPPHCFFEDVKSDSLFMELAPTGDDIWFWAQSILNNYRVHIVDNNITTLKYIKGTQESGLCKVNDVGGEHRPFIVQLRKVLRHYPRLRVRLFVATIRAKLLKRA